MTITPKDIKPKATLKIYELQILFNKAFSPNSKKVLEQAVNCGLDKQSSENILTTIDSIGKKLLNQKNPLDIIYTLKRKLLSYQEAYSNNPKVKQTLADVYNWTTNYEKMINEDFPKETEVIY